MKQDEFIQRLISVIENEINKNKDSFELQIATQNEIISELRAEIANSNTSMLDKHKSVYEEVKEHVNTILIEHNNNIDLLNEGLSDLRKSTLESVNTLSDLIDKKDADIAELKDVAATLETSLLSKHDALKVSVDSELQSISNSLNDAINDIDKDLLDKINEKSELISLKLSDSQNKSLLEITNGLNSKLDSLKGEKGDPGEKGDKGDDGLLTSVNTWTHGVITQKGGVVNYNGGVWLCRADASANTPSIGDEWDLIIDGISDIELNESNIIAKFASGKEKDLGRVGFVHRGVYDENMVYQKGDIVTIDKTSFVSMCDDNTSRPPSGDKWKLLSGRGEKGAKGEKGVKGDPGDAAMPTDDLVSLVKTVVKNEIGE